MASLETFFNDFVKNGTEVSYGNYYVVSGPNAKVLMHYDIEKRPPSKDSLKVAYVRVTHGTTVYCFYNDEAIASKRREDRRLISATAKNNGNAFAMPPSFTVDKDLTSLKVRDTKGESILFDLHSLRFAILQIPLAPTKLSNLFDKAPYSTVYLEISSKFSNLEQIYAGFVPDTIGPEDTFVSGVWLKDTGKEEIPEWLPTQKELQEIANRPQLFTLCPTLDVLAGAGAGINLSGRDYGYGVAISTVGNTRHPQILQDIEKEFKAATAEWASKTAVFQKKYMSFSPNNFLVPRFLMSYKDYVAHSYHDGESLYIKGVLTTGIDYSREPDKSNIIYLKTWHKVIPVLSKNKLVEG